MADLDDLLGDAPPLQHAGSTTTNVGGGGELDDLIGGAVEKPSTVTLDDDFLFGGPTAASAAPPPQHAVQEGTQKSSRQSAAISIAPLAAAPSEKMKPLIQDLTKTYFARFAQVYQADRRRAKQAVLVTNTHILTINPSDKSLDRNVPIESVIGVVRQPVLTSKAFGLSKDYELQMLIQVEGDRDLYLALVADSDNGQLSSSSLDILQVLSAVSLSFGIALPVSDLRNEESIESMVNWSNTDNHMRRQYAEALAYRTELQNELQNLSRQDNQLATAIESLKSSSATQAAKDIHDEIEVVQRTLAELASKIEGIERSKRETGKILASLQADLEREENRRATAVRATMEAGAQSALMRQVSEYEIMKAAHKRDMDKIAALTAMAERRKASRTQSHYTAATIALRLDVLDEEESLIEEKRAEIAQGHVARTAALVEAKKRLALAKSALADATAEVQLVQTIPSSEPLPKNIRTDPWIVYDPVTVVLAPTAPLTTKKPLAADDDDLVTLPPKPSAVPKAAAPILLDDDDDI